MDSIICCPICGQPLSQIKDSMCCLNNHNFDFSKYHYINLLPGNKPALMRGDNREMSFSRNKFLEKGFYIPLAKAISQYMKNRYKSGNVLDICCGDGWYTSQIKQDHPNNHYYCFDISKEMVRLASKRKDAFCFVANLSHIPIRDHSIDFALHLFAPFNESEFSRILSSDGRLISVIPGKNHLWGLKEILYERPYVNDEKEPLLTGSLTVEERIRVHFPITIEEKEIIRSLYYMTPYCYRTPQSGIDKLERLETLKTDCDFILLVMRRSSCQ